MLSRIGRRILMLLIRAYQLCLSPLFGRTCRFYPSCSTYSLEAISRHGCRKGVGLSIKRICKCHPFHPGGVDLVPGDEINATELRR
jgi:putative membrane protein insertion efficiency factor